MLDNDKYVGVLSRHLRLQHTKKQEIICELENHLEDRASELEKQGFRKETAQSLALKQMGDPTALARQMQEVHSFITLKELGMAVVPHFLLAGLVAFRICDNFLVVALTLGFIAVVTWVSWCSGNPRPWSYPWMGFSLAAPGIFALMVLLAPGKSFDLPWTESGLQLNLYLNTFFCVYFLISLWFATRVVLKVVRHDWALVAFSAWPIALLTGWALLAQWREVPLGAQAGSINGNELSWVIAFLTIAAMTAGFLKFGRRPLRAFHILLFTGALALVGYATFMVNYHLVPVQLTMLAFAAVLLTPFLRRPLSFSLRIIQSVCQTSIHMIGR